VYVLRAFISGLFQSNINDEMNFILTFFSFDNFCGEINVVEL